MRSQAVKRRYGLQIHPLWLQIQFADEAASVYWSGLVTAAFADFNIQSLDLLVEG